MPLPFNYENISNIVPQFQNLFKVYIEFDSEKNSEILNIVSSLPSNLYSNNKLYLVDQTTLTLPDVSVETLEIPNQSFNLKQQSSITFGEEVTITVMEQSDFLYRNIFQKWIDLIYNYLDQTQITPKKYKQNLIVEHHQKLLTTPSTTTPSTFVVQTYKFVNQYPTSIQGNELDYTSTDLLTRDITFRYDYLKEIVGKLSLPHLTEV